MPTKTIGEHMRDILLEGAKEINYKGTLVAGYGTPDEIHECARRSGMYDKVKGDKGSHPLNINNKVLMGLERSPLFKKSYIKHIGRPARAYILLESVGKEK
ncbi:hypothetical protein [Erysipelothrix anatis]|uniref:hypothetical protein n=1 Tax=Erysipelothrix anatis TaxID=2683713 RepID=UPI00135A5006|nr:hypothetical protein [Erysipelothrix anatis]